MPPVNNLNTFILGIPQQMPIMGPMTPMPGTSNTVFVNLVCNCRMTV